MLTEPGLEEGASLELPLHHNTSAKPLPRQNLVGAKGAGVQESFVALILFYLTPRSEGCNPAAFLTEIILGSKVKTPMVSSVQ